MKTVQEAIEFVNGQAVFHDNLAAKFLKQDNKLKHDRHKQLAHDFKSLADNLAILQPSKTSPELAKLSLKASDIEGLPPEVIKELSISDSDQFEMNLRQLVAKSGGTISLDQIIVYWYKIRGEVLQRKTLTSKLYRMCQKGLLHSVPGVKGAYSLSPVKTDTGKNNHAADKENASEG